MSAPYNAHPLNLENCLLYLPSMISQFLDLIDCMVFYFTFIAWQCTHSIETRFLANIKARVLCWAFSNVNILPRNNAMQWGSKYLTILWSCANSVTLPPPPWQQIKKPKWVGWWKKLYGTETLRAVPSQSNYTRICNNMTAEDVRY